MLAEDESIRRKLAALYLNHPNVRPDDVDGLMHPVPILIGSTSLDWLLDQLPAVPAAQRINWAYAISLLASDPATATPCWDKLLISISEVPELATQCEWVHAWELDGSRARKAKDYWVRIQMSQAEYENTRNKLAMRLGPGIEAAFSKFEQGDDRAWVSLWYQLAIGEYGNNLHFFACDVTACPNWTLLTSDQREAVPDLTRAFLLSDARTEDYSNITNGGLAARSAIWMLRETLETDARLREAVVDSWLTVMVWDVDSGSVPRYALFQLAYAMAPDPTRKELLRQEKANAAKLRYPSALQLAADCWDSDLSATEIQLIEWSSDALFVLNGLTDLATRDREAARRYVTRVLESVVPGGPSYPIHLFGALVTGLVRGTERIWLLAEPLLNADDELARTVLAKVCHSLDMSQGGGFKQLSEHALGAIYLMLQRQYPASSDPPLSGEGPVFAADCARRIRGQLPGMIAARGTEAACGELLRLSVASPEQATWLRWTYREAVTNVRRNLWKPPPPETVKAMLVRPQARLLTSDDDLLELVLESLARLQTRLTRQSLPGAEDLWHWDGAGLNRSKFRPKDEEALSDYIARWLAEDIGPAAGVVVNREVQPRRGARSDIVVEANVPGANAEFDKFTVVIEVKGCWHAAACTGLRSQLVEGYLRVHGWRCGIYLVGWFVCPQWESKKNNLQSDTPADAVTELEALAADFDGVHSDFRVSGFLLDCSLPPVKSPSV